MLIVSTSVAARSSMRAQVSGVRPIAFTGVTVLDVTTGRMLPNQTVLVVGARIQAVGSASKVRIPTDARVIPAAGEYLLPGLWDMHAHVDDQTWLYPRFIAYGVTGLREMAQRFPGGLDSFPIWQRRIQAGTMVGPRVWGPSIDLTYHVILETPEDAVRIVDAAANAGAKFLKVHDDFMAAPLYFAVAREARKVGIPFVGHLPRSVTEVQAADSGQRSIEHVEEHHYCWPNWPAPVDTTSPACVAAARAYVRDGTWMVPTLAGAKYVDKNVPLAQQFVGFMHRAGVPMMTGTDISIEYMATDSAFQPGRSLLDEVELLVGAGFTPLGALQAATINPARFFQATDSLGTVAPGKLADLVLLAADPLADIHHIRSIVAVVANGHYFDRAALDTLAVIVPGVSPPIFVH